MILLILVSFMALALSLTICVSEIIHERDWPRDTGKYPLIFGFTTLILICAAA
jgi:hypothetical protein